MIRVLPPEAARRVFDQLTIEQPRGLDALYPSRAVTDGGE